MTITYQYDNDVIVYALEKIISYARKTQQIFVAQCIWWLASIIGLDQGLTDYIDNIRVRQEVNILPAKARANEKTISPEPRDLQADKGQELVLKKARFSCRRRAVYEIWKS
jgi:hypothetical protein